MRVQIYFTYQNQWLEVEKKLESPKPHAFISQTRSSGSVCEICSPNILERLEDWEDSQQRRCRRGLGPLTAQHMGRGSSRPRGPRTLPASSPQIRRWMLRTLWDGGTLRGMFWWNLLTPGPCPRLTRQGGAQKPVVRRSRGKLGAGRGLSRCWLQLWVHELWAWASGCQV